MTTSTKRNHAPAIMWRDIKYFIAFGFGSGAMPFAPGTFGTLMAIPFYLLLSKFSWSVYLFITIILFAACSWLCDVCERELNVHDHQGMVIDEIIAYFIVMFAMPVRWQWIVLGFLLFRLFDIWKPWPISWADQHVKGGFGVMFDDVLAAVFAWVCLQGMRLVFG